MNICSYRIARPNTRYDCWAISVGPSASNSGLFVTRAASRYDPAAASASDSPLSELQSEGVPQGVCEPFRLYGLSAFVNDSSPIVRKHVAKALRRLEAWTLLNEMAAAHPDDEKVQWFATARTTHRVFADRLQNFMTAVDSSRAEEVTLKSRMPFWSKDQSWERTPPTSVLFIRRMLVRIRRWVRLGVS